MAVTKVPYQDTTAMGVYLKTGPAPVNDAVFSLNIKAGESALITFPPTVTIPEGSTGAQFDVTWAAAGTTVLQAELTEYGGIAPISSVIYEADIECLIITSSIQKLAPDTIDGLVEDSIPLTVVFSNPVDGDQVVSISSDDDTIALPQESSITVLNGTQTQEVLIDLLKLGGATITATHASGSKTSDITVVAKGYGPSVCEEGPVGISAFELVPVGQSAERTD